MPNGFLTDVRLPINIERGAVGGPRFKTTVLELDSGFEKRNIDWSQGRGEWDIGYGLLQKFQEDPASLKLDLDELVHFFYIVQGRAFSFRFKDWLDFEIGRENGVDITAQLIALGDGTTGPFQIFKRYQVGTNTYDRVITKLVATTMQAFRDGVEMTEGVDYTLNNDTGVITLTVALAATGGTGPGGEEVLTVRVDFDVHARLDTDELKISMETFNAGAWPSIVIVELRGTGI
jgi:uncharacterized protein (TIGR02217 family)